ncbi:hypothetical protein V9K92_01955 [Phyllobacterium sp. CCNWLW109]|uniref:hypothetical protein n=1 Tax=Phyllobacterium sp. CCNWLW109 TaxID=3127479 RepID=UPI00307736A7
MFSIARLVPLGVTSGERRHVGVEHNYTWVDIGKRLLGADKIRTDQDVLIYRESGADEPSDRTCLAEGGAAPSPLRPW